MIRSRREMTRPWLWVLSLALFISACSQNQKGTSVPQSTGASPLPSADSSAPSEINAPLAEAPALIQLDMFNEREGWGVSDMNIVRTSDGGSTWYNVTPPEIDETGFGVDLFALDTEHAWLQKPEFENYPNSGILYRTSDGGLTWKDASVPFSRGAIHFLNEDQGWVLADLGVGAGSNAVAVFQTSDGGVTWEKMYTNDPNDPNAKDTLPLGGIKSDILPLNMDIAWVSGVIYDPGEVFLYRTDDGGRSWIQVPLVLPQGGQNFELGIDDGQMELVSAREGFIALRMSGESTQTAFYVTDDAGGTWTLMPMVIDGAGDTEFLSSREAILYDGEQFYVTRDAARSWVTVAPDVAFGETFAGMEFVNTMTGWAITLDPTTNHRSLYRSEDGGATWLPVLP